MPLKIIGVRFEEPAVPFEAASELLSYVAYPSDERKRRRFSAALCRVEHLQEAQRKSEWACFPQRIRPLIFAPNDESFVRDLHFGINTLRLRLITATAMLMPHLIAFVTGKNPPKVEGFAPTVENIARYIMEKEGLNLDTSESTFKSRVWAPTRPVAHLAFSFAQKVFIKRWGKAKTMQEILTPYPDEEVLRNIMDHAENIRTILPKLRQFRFSEDDTIKFVRQT
jgi:hypothetical protein